MTEIVEKGLKKIGITISKPVLAILCIIFGIIVIAWKESLNYVVGIFLIIEDIDIHLYSCIDKSIDAYASACIIQP